MQLIRLIEWRYTDRIIKKIIFPVSIKYLEKHVSHQDLNGNHTWYTSLALHLGRLE